MGTGPVTQCQLSAITIVTLRDSVDNILIDTWYNQKKDDIQEEKLRIVKKAVEIIRENVLMKTHTKDSYPAPNDFLRNSVNNVPESLHTFLKTLAGNFLF